MRLDDALDSNAEESKQINQLSTENYSFSVATLPEYMNEECENITTNNTNNKLVLIETLF